MCLEEKMLNKIISQSTYQDFKNIMDTLFADDFPHIDIPEQTTSIYNKEIDYPLIEFDKNYYTYNFSYLPLPLFLSTSGIVDTRSMLLLPNYNDGEQLDYFKFTDILQAKKMSFKITTPINTLYLYSQSAHIFKLVELNNKKISKYIRPGLNIIRLSQVIQQENIDLVFDSQDHSISSVSVYNSIYSKSFQFTIRQEHTNIYKILQSNTQNITVNGQKIINNSFFQLTCDKSTDFVFNVEGENCFVEKIIVSKNNF